MSYQKIAELDHDEQVVLWKSVEGFCLTSGRAFTRKPLLIDTSREAIIILEAVKIPMKVEGDRNMLFIKHAAFSQLLQHCPIQTLVDEKVEKLIAAVAESARTTP